MPLQIALFAADGPGINVDREYHTRTRDPQVVQRQRCSYITNPRHRRHRRIAGLVSAPRYTKNLIRAGNPVYPFPIEGPDWPAARVPMLMTYLRSFGVRRSLVDTLLLPLHLSTQRAAFGAFISGIDIPNLLFLPQHDPTGSHAIAQSLPMFSSSHLRRIA